MQIAVCIKQIPDPVTSSVDFQIDKVAKKAVDEHVKLVINPYDENAIELALQLKGRHPGSSVTAFSIGPEPCRKALRHALALGCDDVVWLKDPAFEQLDSAGTAKVLSRAIRKAGTFDLILCGRQAGDSDMGQVGSLLAEELSLACVRLVSEIERVNGKLNLKRELKKGYEILEAGLSVLATVTSSSTNQPRYASVKGVMMAARRQLTTWSAGELGFDGAIPRAVVVEDLKLPDYARRLQLIEGEDSAERAANLARHLIELNLLT